MLLKSKLWSQYKVKFVGKKGRVNRVMRNVGKCKGQKRKCVGVREQDIDREKDK